MPSEAIKNFYREIMLLSAKIGELRLPIKFIDAAKKKDKVKIKEIMEQSKKKYPELWWRLSKFYETYKNENHPVIFGDKDSDEYYKYDSSKINSLNLCFIIMFSQGMINESEIFTDFKILQNELSIECPELARVMSWTYIDTLEYPLIKAFEEKIIFP